MIVDNSRGIEEMMVVLWSLKEVQCGEYRAVIGTDMMGGDGSND